MEGPVCKADLGAARGRQLSLRMDRSLPAETKSQIIKQAGQSSRLTEEGPAQRDGWGQSKAETKTWLKRARRAGREGTKLSLVTCLQLLRVTPLKLLRVWLRRGEVNWY